MVWSATLADLWCFGLPGAAAVPEARPIASVDPHTCTFEVPGHALGGGERVRFRASGAGAALPVGLTSGRYLVPAPDDPDFFTITTTAGAPVTLGDAGEGALVVLVDTTPRLLRMLEARTSFVVAHAKAYRGPWQTPPAWAPMIVAQLVAYDAAAVLRVTSPQFTLDELRERAETALEFLANLDAGKPYDDGAGPVDATPAVQEMGAALVVLDGRGFLDADEEARA